jgi:pimeloyl-ACP methyl ester carboxylesterase
VTAHNGGSTEGGAGSPGSGSAAVQAQARSSFRFSADGRYAACVAHVGAGWLAETWALPATGEPRRLGAWDSMWSRVQVLPRTDGAVWVCQPTGADEHEVALADTNGADTIAGITGHGLRLVATCSGNRVIAVSTAAGRAAGSVRSTVWMLGDTATPVLTVPGLLGGGVKLPNRVALSWARDGRLSTVLVDLIDGSLTCPWPNATGRRLLLAGPGTDADVYVVAEGERIGWCRADHREPVWPAALRPGRHSHLLPLAVSPDGKRIAFRSDAGARSDLLLYSLETGATELLLMPGVLGATAAWTADGLFAPLAEAGSVAVVLDVGDGRVVRDTSSAAIEEVEFAGPAGPVQAVTYGDLDTARTVIVALHGGPDAAWTLQPDPLLSALAGLGADGSSAGGSADSSGCAVVAVNPRGSKGRPPGQFGVEDVEDIRAVVQALRDRGSRLALLGGSYGAYLALRTLCAEPEAFAQVALTAPFWSMSLYDQAGSRVRALLDRIAPLESVSVRALSAVRARVLILGGALDETVPPSHVDGLHTTFRQAGLEVRRIELPNSGHHLHGPDFRQAIESWFTSR